MHLVYNKEDLSFFRRGHLNSRYGLECKQTNKQSTSCTWKSFAGLEAQSSSDLLCDNMYSSEILENIPDYS